MSSFCALNYLITHFLAVDTNPSPSNSHIYNHFFYYVFTDLFSISFYVGV